MCETRTKYTMNKLTYLQCLLSAGSLGVFRVLKTASKCQGTFYLILARGNARAGFSTSNYNFPRKSIPVEVLALGLLLGVFGAGHGPDVPGST